MVTLQLSAIREIIFFWITETTFACAKEKILVVYQYYVAEYVAEQAKDSI